MDEIRVENFRCFRGEQIGRLAPLTLLVGENSTGKTSFLAAIRAIADIAYGPHLPDFKEDPYDLGSFDEIAHYRGAGGGRAETFKVGLSAPHSSVVEEEGTDGKIFHLDVTFGRRGTAPIPVRRRFALEDTWVQEYWSDGEPPTVEFGTPRGNWKLELPDSPRPWGPGRWWFPLMFGPFRARAHGKGGQDGTEFVAQGESPPPNSDDMRLLDETTGPLFGERPFASAPVRSKPRRTYDPAPAMTDPEGDNVPMYLADLYFRNKQTWTVLQQRLKEFGEAAGLFNEISIRPLSKRDSDPFQIQVRKSSGQRKGPWRNLIDVGYGVSQVLPVVTELLRPGAREMLLLQQPEVHLHPSGQAALGSLFCQIAGLSQQIVVETHSDYLINRVRMEVRDGASGIKPEEVSILFFQRSGLEVEIHPLTIDKDGNINGEPPGYGQFFMNEATRLLWTNQQLEMV